MNESEYVKGMLARTSLFFDEASIEKVRNTVFAISGLGGVGAITAELLARWGVKKFRLLDMDTYDPSNMNRQLFATSKTLGERKIDVAERRIKEINPYAEIEMKVFSRVNNENVHPFVSGAGMVIQNADHPSCKLFYLAAGKHKVPLVNGHAGLTGGRVQAFDYRAGPCKSRFEDYWTRFKFGSGKQLEEMTPEEVAAFDRQYVHPTAPSVNFVVNTVGCLIVAEAIKMITGKGKAVLYPKYLTFDTFTYSMKIRRSNSILNPDNIKRFASILRNK